jgi:tetratricopeptide (TPR) repeat protein
MIGLLLLLVAQDMNALDTQTKDALAAREIAERGCERGIKQAFELSTDKAIATFEEALASYSRATLAVTDYAPMARCIVHLGAAWLVQGKREKALALLQQAIVLDSTFRPSLADFSPDVVKAYVDAEKKAARIAVGSITVTGQPIGAKVVLDARERGPLPISISGLMPGVHWLAVTMPGFEPFSTRVILPDASGQKTEVFLSKTSTAAPAATAVKVPSVDNAVPAVQATERPLRLAAPKKSSVHPALAILPFGVGQFAEGRHGAGAAFLVTEVALLAGSIVAGVLVLNDRAVDGTYYDAPRDRVLQGVNITAFSLFIAEVLGGGVDGYFHRHD